MGPAVDRHGADPTAYPMSRAPAAPSARPRMDHDALGAIASPVLQDVIIPAVMIGNLPAHHEELTTTGAASGGAHDPNRSSVDQEIGGTTAAASASVHRNVRIGVADSGSAMIDETSANAMIDEASASATSGEATSGNAMTGAATLASATIGAVVPGSVIPNGAMIDAASATADRSGATTVRSSGRVLRTTEAARSTEASLVARAITSGAAVSARTIVAFPVAAVRPAMIPAAEPHAVGSEMAPRAKDSAVDHHERNPAVDHRGIGSRIAGEMSSGALTMRAVAMSAVTMRRSAATSGIPGTGRAGSATGHVPPGIDPATSAADGRLVEVHARDRGATSGGVRRIAAGVRTGCPVEKSSASRVADRRAIETKAGAAPTKAIVSTAHAVHPGNAVGSIAGEVDRREGVPSILGPRGRVAAVQPGAASQDQPGGRGRHAGAATTDSGP